jgi:glyoxylase-like metal-dependent hydrolase (beta-lactamase superfamily II)
MTRRRITGIPAAVAISAAGLWAQAVRPQNPGDAEIRVLPVQGNVYMLVGAGGNIALQAGKDGALLVDSMTAPLAPKIAAEVKKLTSRPIRFILNTHVHPDHTGGNGALAALGEPGSNNSRPGATVIAHENVLRRMTTPVIGGPPPAPEADLPSSEYYLPTRDLYFNGEPVILFHEPKAHTDGDSIVLFRRSDVIAAGDVFTPERYPEIDVERGGSVQGLIAALNHILRLSVPERLQEGGTRVIPGHGRLCDEADVVEYRDMVTIVRDRVADLLRRGMTLAQVQAARPTLDYDPQYGNPEAFVEAVYRSLAGK